RNTSFHRIATIPISRSGVATDARTTHRISEYLVTGGESMDRTSTVLLLACVLVLTFAAVPSAQKLASVAGKWDVTIRMPNRSSSEQWTIQQKGNAITATAKGDRGELPVAGMVEGAF